MSVPLVALPVAVETRLAELGGRPVNLYRALANQPDMLAAWVEFAWSVRQKPGTPRRLRELMIVRAGEMTGCDYEVAHHRAMALRAGVSQAELDALAGWRASGRFSEPERAALAFLEAMVEGSVPEAVNAELARHFDAAERVELALTAGLYSMVPRVIDALRVPLETDGIDSPER